MISEQGGAERRYLTPDTNIEGTSDGFKTRILCDSWTASGMSIRACEIATLMVDVFFCSEDK